MTRSRRALKVLLPAVAGFMVWHPSLASATTYYWDVNGNIAGIGGGALSTDWPSAHWSTSVSGNINTIAWPNTNPNADQAYFSGSVGTVTIDSPIFVNSLYFNTAGYTIAPNGNSYLTLSGTTPTINVDLPVAGAQTIVSINAPFTGTAGFTLNGPNNSSPLRFLQLGNTSSANVNNFSGALTINVGGALRLGGGSLTEQIGDNADMFVYGVMDFVTSGSAANEKVEKVRNITVSGTSSNFSVGNGAKFTVNAATISSTGTAPGIALNGNTGLVQPSTLDITGWSDGNATLTMSDGTLRMNATGGASALGSVVKLAGDIIASGNSWIYNQNGGGGGTATTNTFNNQGFSFTSGASTINVASGGTLTFSSAAPTHPITITSAAAGTNLIKIGQGDLLLANAIEVNATFTGTNEVREGTWTLGASDRLADNSNLLVSGGTFRMQGFNETVNSVRLDSGTISAVGLTVGVLTSVSSFDVRSGYIDAKLSGVNKPLTKSTTGTVILKGSQSYSGSTTVTGGTLSLQGNLASPTLSISAGKLRAESLNIPNDPHGANRFSSLSIAPGAQLDLGNNAMVLDYSSPGTLVEDVRQHILAGRISYLASPDFRLGYADNQSLQINTFAGKDVSSHNNVLLKYTYAGDANLDGQVDIKDLFQLAQSWQSSGTWFNGDFNYDGIVNAKDLGLLAVEWQAGAGNPVPAASFDSVLASLNLPAPEVPEPAVTGILSIGAAWLLKRPRARRRNPA